MSNSTALELYRMDGPALLRIAAKLKIPIPDGTSRFDIIDIIRLFPDGSHGVELEQTQSETPPEMPSYSLRIQRIRDNNP